MEIKLNSVYIYMYFIGAFVFQSDITWNTNPETSEASILVLYNKSDVIMWDFLTSSQLWRTSFSEPVSNIFIDPFNRNNAICKLDHRRKPSRIRPACKRKRKVLYKPRP